HAAITPRSMVVGNAAPMPYPLRPVLVPRKSPLPTLGGPSGSAAAAHHLDMANSPAAHTTPASSIRPTRMNRRMTIWVMNPRTAATRTTPCEKPTIPDPSHRGTDARNSPKLSWKLLSGTPLNARYANPRTTSHPTSRIAVTDVRTYVRSCGSATTNVGDSDSVLVCGPVPTCARSAAVEEATTQLWHLDVADSATDSGLRTTSPRERSSWCRWRRWRRRRVPALSADRRNRRGPRSPRRDPPNSRPSRF